VEEMKSNLDQMAAWSKLQHHHDIAEPTVLYGTLL